MARKTQKPKPKQVEWRVREIMEQREVPSVSALKRLLEEIGVTVSISNLGRLIDGKMKLWNQEVIEGLLTVLDCEIGDILTVAAEPSKKRPGKM